MSRSHKPPEPVDFFVTQWWRSRGEVALTGFVEDGRFSNWTCYRELGDRPFSGRIGYSAFATRDEARAAIRKKAAAAVKTMRKELARIEAIANGDAS